MGSTYQQAAIPVVDPERFGRVKASVQHSFAPATVATFLRSLERQSVRIRDFEGVLGRGLLGKQSAAEYEGLSAGDQGQIREIYLQALEQVPTDLRDRYFKLYAYY